jgi:hypothetical protein
LLGARQFRLRVFDFGLEPMTSACAHQRGLRLRARGSATRKAANEAVEPRHDLACVHKGVVIGIERPDDP